MKSHENILIVMLLLTAGILGVMVYGTVDNNQASADMVDRYGNYIMVTGKVDTNADMLYVIDVPRQKLVAYAIDGLNNKLQVADDKVDLKRVFRK
ncbi:MAG: hypothetical protein K8S55_00130 [Phycisphaerae bacterium]|nr:hypothetical protein [Phycisphaerae bacterium]